MIRARRRRRMISASVRRGCTEGRGSLSALRRSVMRWMPCLVLFAACLGLRGAAAPAAEAASAADDERTLRAARVGTDGPALLEFFRKRTVNDVDNSRIEKLIEQ